jgi:hypothetical protein
MPIGSVAILLTLAALAFAEGRARAAGRWRRLGALILAGLAMAIVVRGGVDTRAILGTPLFDLPALVAGLLAAVDLIGLPLPVARRLHLGLHSREWEFDGRLFALAQEARRTVEAPRADRELTARRLPAIIGKISALRAPDQDWATVRDGWVAAWEQYLKLLSNGSDLGGDGGGPRAPARPHRTNRASSASLPNQRLASRWQGPVAPACGPLERVSLPHADRRDVDYSQGHGLAKARRANRALSGRN